MNEGMSKLANVLNGRMKENTEANSSLILDFGVIQSDYSLLTNTYPIPIPKTDYLVLRQLTLGATGSVLTSTTENGGHTHTAADGSHSHDGGTHDGHESGDGSHSHSGGAHSHGAVADHKHNVLIPEKMRWIQPGDRVLVGWVQHDAVVLDIIYEASAVG